MTKTELRLLMREQLRQQSEEYVRLRSTQIVKKLEHLFSQYHRNCIGVFASKGLQEPNISPFIQELLLKGKTVAFPVVKNGEVMEFYAVENLQKLSRKRFDILEPVVEDECKILPEQFDAVLVPGLAFTTTGKRLGRSKGYYDRWLSQLSKGCVKIGVCFSVQIVDDIPVDHWDVHMDMVITEADIITVL